MLENLSSDELSGALTALAIVCAVPTALYAWYERRGRVAWPAPPPSAEQLAFEGYRRVRAPRLSAPKAPAYVRVAALSCFAFGQMFLPGLALGVFGLIAGGTGVVSLPGLWVASSELGLGRDLLARAPRAAERARTVASVSVALNLALLTLCALGLSSRSMRGPAELVTAYVIASLAQAACLFWVARRLDADAAPASPQAPTANDAPVGP
jgi:hypothetical protein